MCAALNFDWIRINLKSRRIVCDNPMSFKNQRNLVLVFLKVNKIGVGNS